MATDDMEELRRALAASKDLEAGLRQAANDAAARASAFEAEAKDSSKREQAAKSQINRYAAIAEKAEGDFARQKELLQQAIGRNAGFQITINGLRTDLDVSKHKAEYAEKELGLARTECGVLGHRLMETQKAISAREGESAAASATLKHQLATMLYEVENEREQRKRAEERLPVFVKQVAALKKAVEDRDAKFSELSSTREKDIAELEGLLRTVKEVRGATRRLERKRREGLSLCWLSYHRAAVSVDFPSGVASSACCRLHALHARIRFHCPHCCRRTTRRSTLCRGP